MSEVVANRVLQQALAASGGTLRFDRFMSLALYHPTVGYYTSRPDVLGPSGDFTTASEMTPVYGATLATAIAGDLAALDGGRRVIEFGAGSGAFAVALMSALTQQGGARGLPDEYVICEISPTLRSRQAERIASALPDLFPRFRWMSPHEIPKGPGVVVANELLDALPVRRFVWHTAGLRELWVACNESSGPRGLDAESGTNSSGDLPLIWRERQVSRRVEAALMAHYGDVWSALEEGAVVDVNARIPALFRRFRQCLTNGSIWLTDYGESRHEYYHPQRTAGTLVCHWQHRVEHDPLVRVGAQDITAAVDFTRVAECATETGLTVSTYATQAHALMMLGVDLVVADLTDERAQLSARMALKTLLLPGQMGERMKVMVLSTPGFSTSAAFGRFDMRHRL